MEQSKNNEAPERNNTIFLCVVFALGFVMVISSKYIIGSYMMFVGTYMLAFGLLFLLYLIVKIRIEDGINNEKNNKDSEDKNL